MVSSLLSLLGRKNGRNDVVAVVVVVVLLHESESFERREAVELGIHLMGLGGRQREIGIVI